MKRWVAFGVVGLAMVAAIVAMLAHSRGAPRGPTAGSGAVAATPSGLDPLVDDFRATERTCIARFNELLRQQREQSIDEVELATAIERDVLAPWRTLRARVGAAPPHDELYTTLRRYLETRQLSWEAYVAALRAPSDEAARPHYEAHRLNNAQAQDQAKVLGRLFREAATQPPAR